MTDTDPPRETGPAVAWRRWRRWLGAFWFVRGVATAGAFVAMVGGVLDLRHELLAAVHAFILGWNDAAALLGALLARLIALPPIPADLVNATILFLSFSVPSSVFIVKRQLEVLRRDDPAAGRSDAGRLVAFLGQRIRRDLVLTWATPPWRSIPELTRVAIRNPIYFLGLSLGSPPALFMTIGLYEDVARRQGPAALFELQLYAALGAAGVAIAYWLGFRPFLRAFPSFRAGLLSTAGFIIGLEALYLLHAPVVREWLRTYSCSAQAAPPPWCREGAR